MPALTSLSVIPYEATVEAVVRDNPNARKGVCRLDAAIPTGSVFLFAGTSVPAGWLYCDGQAVSRTTYADLFGAIGVQFGNGNGSTTFNVPDFRGRVPVCTGQGAGLTTRVTGDSFGAEEHTLDISEMPEHSHSLQGLGSGSGGSFTHLSRASSDQLAWVSDPSYPRGGDQPHNNMQPSLAIGFIVKY